MVRNHANLNDKIILYIIYNLVNTIEELIVETIHPFLLIQNFISGLFMAYDIQKLY